MSLTEGADSQAWPAAMILHSPGLEAEGWGLTFAMPSRLCMQTIHGYIQACFGTLKMLPSLTAHTSSHWLFLCCPEIQAPLSTPCTEIDLLSFAFGDKN